MSEQTLRLTRAEANAAYELSVAEAVRLERAEADMLTNLGSDVYRRAATRLREWLDSTAYERCLSCGGTGRDNERASRPCRICVGSGTV